MLLLASDKAAALNERLSLLLSSTSGCFCFHWQAAVARGLDALMLLLTGDRTVALYEMLLLSICLVGWRGRQSSAACQIARRRSNQTQTTTIQRPNVNILTQELLWALVSLLRFLLPRSRLRVYHGWLSLCCWQFGAA
jgi:hypothetical protein